VVVDVLIQETRSAAADSDDDEPMKPAFMSQLAVFVFAFDVLLRIWAMGARAYFRDFLCWTDFILSALDLVQFVSPGTQLGPKSMGRLLRIVRFMKLCKCSTEVVY
jgi:hypothetical protein